jgi:DNA-binding response OmpR family regulator
MPVFHHATDPTEQLAQVVALLRQTASLLEAVDPSAVKRLVLGAVTPSHQRPLALDHSKTPSGNGSAHPSIIDEETFSVHWANRTCRLGNTLSFGLLARLALRPNQFISYEVLCKDVWKDEYTSHEAVRSAVKVLRRKLIAAGMADLAEAIDGRNSRHYALMLAER